MTNSEALNYLLKLATDGEKSYHAGYSRTVKYAKDCKAYIGGVGLDEYMRPFARRESEELFKQRKEITAQVQSALGNMLDKPVAKIERSNWTKVVTVANDNEDGAKARAFEANTLSKFGKNGLFGYVFDRLRYWNKYDPNAFVVVEFSDFDNRETKAQPYPFEVTADMAVDFRYMQDRLEYLAVRQVQEKEEKEGAKKKVQRLTLYQPIQTLVLQQLTDTEAKAAGVSSATAKMFSPDVQDGDTVRDESGNVYQAIIPLPHNSMKTPAIRAGYVDSPEDDGKTVLSIYDAALPFAKKLLKINSELDLVMALLAFPVSIRHEEVCDATGCNKGLLADNSTCLACHGTGYKPRPTSAQEEILLPLPDRNEDMLDVSKILTYTYPPTEAVKLQIEVWEKWMSRSFQAVYNSEMYTKDQVAQTAMFHGVQLQGIYDVLYPYGRHISRVAAYLGSVIGDFTAQPGATAMPLIPSDLRFETVEDSFAQLKSHRDAGGGNDGAAILQGRIMERLLRDDPEALRRWRVDDYFNPFSGMTEEQILEAMNSGLVPERKKVFYVNSKMIMDGILDTTPNFYTLARTTQKQLIEAATDALMRELEEQKPALNVGAFARKDVNLGDNAPQPSET